MLARARPGVVLLLFAATTGCTPLDDVMAGIFGRHMRDSRSFDPYENTLAPAPNSVPFAAGNITPGPGQLNTGQPERGVNAPPFTQADLFQPIVQALPNPVAATEASLTRGEELFNRMCAVCHGEEGVGAQAFIVDKYPLLDGVQPVGSSGRGVQRRIHLRHHPGRTRPHAPLRTPDQPLRSLEHRELRPRVATASGQPASGAGGWRRVADEPGRRPHRNPGSLPAPLQGSRQALSGHVCPGSGGLHLRLGYRLGPHLGGVRLELALFYGVVDGGHALAVATWITKSKWNWSVRRVSLSFVAFLPISFVMLLPMLGLGESFFPWIEEIPHDPILQKKAAYLNMPFLVTRT